MNSSGNDQNKLIAVIITLFLLYLYKTMVWDPYFYPAQPNQLPGAQGSAQSAPTQQAHQAATPASPADQFVEPGKIAPSAPEQKYPTDAEIRAKGLVVVESDDLLASLSLLGGRVTELLLKKYAATNDPNSARLSMIEHVEFAPYPGGVYSGGIDDSRVMYVLASNHQTTHENQVVHNPVSPGQKESVTLRGTLPDGREITKTYTFNPTGFFIDLAVILSAPARDSSRLSVEWTKLIAKDSASLLDPYNITGYVWFDGQKALRETFAKLPVEGQELSNIVWLSAADKYFVTTLLSGDGAAAARLFKTGDLYRARLLGSGTEKHMQFFVGPKNYRILQEVGHEMHRNIDFGKTAIIAIPLLLVLHMLHDSLGNYGLAIVLLTIFVKFLMYPLTASSFKQMKALQDLAPDLKRIRETVSDRQQQQLETMQLYKEKGVNPLGGCLPIVLQMPVFIGLYSALLLDIELRHAPFALWINDLSGPEQLHVFGFSVPVMVILFVASMLIQQWMTPTTADPAQKKAMLIVPLVFGFLFASMPAGLTLYWLTNNLISIGQQTGLKKGGSSALKLTAYIASGVFLFAYVLTKL